MKYWKQSWFSEAVTFGWQMKSVNGVLTETWPKELITYYNPLFLFTVWTLPVWEFPKAKDTLIYFIQVRLSRHRAWQWRIKRGSDSEKKKKQDIQPKEIIGKKKNFFFNSYVKPVEVRAVLFTVHNYSHKTFCTVNFKHNAYF